MWCRHGVRDIPVKLPLRRQAAQTQDDPRTRERGALRTPVRVSPANTAPGNAKGPGSKTFDSIVHPAMPPSSTTTAARDVIVGTAYVFDACTASVIGRTVLLVETLAAITVGFGSTSLSEWFMQLALVTAVTLPACLLWLLVACQQKKMLQRCSTRTNTSLAPPGAYSAGWQRPCSTSGRRWRSTCPGSPVKQREDLYAAAGVGLQWRAQGRTPAATYSGWPSCRRASVRISCSTRSTAPSRWYRITRTRPSPCLKI